MTTQSTVNLEFVHILDVMSLNGKITVGVKPYNDRWGLSQVDNFSIGIFLAVEPEMGI